MRYFEDMKIGQRSDLGSFTFTAELIKTFASQFDPQRFHLDEEEGRKSLFGGLAASGWHVGSVCMKLLVAEGQREAAEAAARGEKPAVWGPVARVSRSALAEAGAGRRHHQLRQRGRIAETLPLAAGMGNLAGAQYRDQSARRDRIFNAGVRVRAAPTSAGLTQSRLRVLR